LHRVTEVKRLLEHKVAHLASKPSKQAMTIPCYTERRFVRQILTKITEEYNKNRLKVP